MMDCKKGVARDGGPDKAVELLRKAARRHGEAAGRETSAGRIAVYADFDGAVGAMVELQCEERPVASNSEVRPNWPTTWCANWPRAPGAATPDELLAASRASPGTLFAPAVRRLEPPHSRGFQGAARGADQRPLRRLRPSQPAARACWRSRGTVEVARDICMHIAAMRPPVLAQEQLTRPWWPRSARFWRRPPGARQAGKDHRGRWSRAGCALLRRELLWNALREGRQEDVGPGGQGGGHEDPPLPSTGNWARE